MVERGAEPPSVVASIVGTNTRLRDLVAPLLHAEGFDIEALESPIALASAALVVVVDAADEPGSIALDLCREAREKANAGDSIVVITERDDDPSLRALVEAGADELFVLPSDAPRLGPRLAALARRMQRLARLAEGKRDIEQRHEYVYNHAPIILHSIDCERRIVSASDGWLKALGYTREEVLGRPLTSFMTEASAARAELQMPQYLKSGLGHCCYEFIRKDGSVLEVILNVLVERNAAGGPVRTFAVSTDLTQVRAIEEALAAAHDELHALVTAFPDNVYRLSPEGIVRNVHFGAHFRAQQPMAASLLGKPVESILSERDATRVRRGMKEASERDEVITIELDEQFAGTKNAYNIRELRIVALPTRDMLVISRDITDKRHAELALRHYETRMRAVLESAPVILWAIDKSGVITFAEGAGLAALRTTPADVVGKSIFELFRDQPRLSSRLRDALKGQVFHGETEIRGRFFDNYLLPTRDASGAVTGLLGVSTNITERRRAERALREAEQLWHAVFDNAPVGIEIFGPDGTVLRMNEAFRKMIGAPTLTTGIGEFNALTNELSINSGYAEKFARAYAGEIVELHEASFDFPDPFGERKPSVLDLILFPIRDSDKTRAVVAFCRDVTERKHAAARLLLADRLAALGTMAAGVAHEINNPLSFVQSNLEFIANVLAHEEPRAADLQAATEAAAESIEGTHRMRAIVSSLSTFSRSDDYGATPVPVDMHHILEASMRIARHALRHKATVVRDFGASGGALGSESQLGQVFVNLLVNAAQAMPPRLESENVIRIVTRDEPGRVLVEVHDNGGGILPEHIGRIFDPFFTTKPLGEGTGLGLSVCHSIITSLGGDISVESEPNVGAMFRVSLPVAAAPQATSERAPPSDDIAGETHKPHRVLCVDDEPYVCAAIRRVFARELEIVSANSAAEALSLVRSGKRFDAILCDLMMPGESGQALYGALLEHDPSLDRRVGFVTGGASTDEARSFVSDMSDRVLFKPFDVPSLRALVRSLAASKLPAKPAR